MSLSKILARVRTGCTLPASLGKVAEYVQKSRTPSTRRAYQSDLEQFQEWCEKQDLKALPAQPETVSRFIAELADEAKPSTLRRKLAAISVAHQAKGLLSPCQCPLVRSVLQGIMRSKGNAPLRKAPLRAEHLKHLTIPETLSGIRDQALFLVGYSGAFRRSELVNLDVEDLQFVRDGVRIKVRSSKTDQEQMGMMKDIGAVPDSVHCPVEALKEWMKEGCIQSGPLFRAIRKNGLVSEERLSAQSVALIIKKLVEGLGLNPNEFSGHSLRAGFVTDCISNGVQGPLIRKVTGHKSEDMLSEYYREDDLFRHHLTEKLGL